MVQILGLKVEYYQNLREHYCMDNVRITENTSMDKSRKVITSAKSYLYRGSKMHGYELLVLREVSKEGEESYTIPGGSKEGKESLEEAATRELTEETGYCDFRIENYIGSRTYELDWDIIWIKTDHLFLVHLLSDKKATQNLVEYEKEVIKETLWVEIEKAFNLLTRENHAEHISLVKKLLNI